MLTCVADDPAEPKVCHHEFIQVIIQQQVLGLEVGHDHALAVQLHKS
jgi:hypothetical protein